MKIMYRDLLEGINFDRNEYCEITLEQLKEICDNCPEGRYLELWKIDLTTNTMYYELGLFD